MMVSKRQEEEEEQLPELQFDDDVTESDISKLKAVNA
mgnify:CR=1 FL=1|jgi:hypothetical protein